MYTYVLIIDSLILQLGQFASITSTRNTTTPSSSQARAPSNVTARLCSSAPPLGAAN